MTGPVERTCHHAGVNIRSLIVDERGVEGRSARSSGSYQIELPVRIARRAIRPSRTIAEAFPPSCGHQGASGSQRQKD